MNERLKRGIAIASTYAACVGGGALLGSIQAEGSQANSMYTEVDNAPRHAEPTSINTAGEGLAVGSAVWAIGVICVVGCKAMARSIPKAENPN